MGVKSHRFIRCLRAIATARTPYAACCSRYLASRRPRIPPALLLRPIAPISVSWPHAQTRASKGCHPHVLQHHVSPFSCNFIFSFCVPGPLTLRMMLRVVSSMNSTRTWVTPPREPVCILSDLPSSYSYVFSHSMRTGAAEDAGDLDELDGNPVRGQPPARSYCS